MWYVDVMDIRYGYYVRLSIKMSEFDPHLFHFI